MDTAVEIGELPSWKLSDLYPSREAPEVERDPGFWSRGLDMISGLIDELEE